MSIQVRWGNDEKTLIRYNVVNGWDWQDLDEARFVAHDMMATVNHQVNVIVDVRNGHTLPDNPMGNFKRITADRRPPNLGLVVVVGATAFLRAMFNGFSMIYEDRVKSTRMVATWEEAQTLLNESQAQTRLPRIARLRV